MGQSLGGKKEPQTDYTSKTWDIIMAQEICSKN